jgi:dimethylamine monooxygenase subunit A
MLYCPTNDAARYRPYADGKYSVKPGLFRFGTDFGNGDADLRLFQIDRNFQAYREAKQAAHVIRPDDHHLSSNLHPDVDQAVCRFIADRLVEEYPQWFQMGPDARITCLLTHETFQIQAKRLAMLALQVQEDLTVVSVDGDKNWLSAGHVCLPSGWSLKDKIGKDFSAVHERVPGALSLMERQGEYVKQMVNATVGLVRFVWAIGRDYIDGHPSHERSPLTLDNAIIRVERQVIWGLPEVNAALFAIRPYNYQIEEEDKPLLASAVESMSDDAARYKGLESLKYDIIRQWAANGAD